MLEKPLLFLWTFFIAGLMSFSRNKHLLTTLKISIEMTMLLSGATIKTLGIALWINMQRSVAIRVCEVISILIFSHRIYCHFSTSAFETSLNQLESALFFASRILEHMVNWCSSRESLKNKTPKSELNARMAWVKSVHKPLDLFFLRFVIPCKW